MTGDRVRVVITGIGVVSPIGIGREQFWSSLSKGETGIKPVTLFDTSALPSKLAGEINNFTPDAILSDKGTRNLDRTTLLSLCATKLALSDAGYDIDKDRSERVGVVLGTTMGSVWSISEFDKEALRSGPKGVNPALFPNTVINSPSSQIAIKYGIKGLCATISSGLTSSHEAFRYACNAIMTEKHDVILVGGVEELCEQTYKGLSKVGFLSGSGAHGDAELSAPFDRRRNGAVIGEGSVVFQLENYSYAKKRGARILGEVRSVVSLFDPKNCEKNNLAADGLRASFLSVLDDAKVEKKDIQFIASSANSTIGCDMAESRAIAKFFSNNSTIAISSCKSMVGETLSAAGAFQAASAVLAIVESRVHPTSNYEYSDQRCGTISVSSSLRRMEVENAIITGASLSGQVSSMIISKMP